MNRIAFKMKLRAGCEAVYQQRHNDIWPELATALAEAGITDYSIFLDEKTGDLFAAFKVANPVNLDLLPTLPVMQKWWTYMEDIMDTNSDHSPVSVPLEEVFYLP